MSSTAIVSIIAKYTCFSVFCGKTVQNRHFSSRNHPNSGGAKGIVKRGLSAFATLFESMACARFFASCAECEKKGFKGSFGVGESVLITKYFLRLDVNICTPFGNEDPPVSVPVFKGALQFGGGDLENHLFAFSAFF